MENASTTLSAISLIVSFLAVIASILSWSRGRVIYGIERETIRQYKGTPADAFISDDSINAKLVSGRYQIVTSYERPDGDIGIVLAKVRK